MFRIIPLLILLVIQCAGSPTDGFVRASDRGTSCRAGIRSEVCGQWEFLKLAVLQR